MEVLYKIVELTEVYQTTESSLRFWDQKQFAI